MSMREKIMQSKRIVVKVGTSSLTYDNGKLKLNYINRLAWTLADLHNQGKEIVLVSSGAIGVGATRLGFSNRPEDIAQKQASAAVGQAVLMQIYQNMFREYNQTVAQILLTKDDFSDPQRKENVASTFQTLLAFGVIPIVNANDTTSTYEIEFSDNDQLSAYVAKSAEADTLILLTDIDALYDEDPKQHGGATKIMEIHTITEEIMQMAGAKGSKFSVGGMQTKLLAAAHCEENNIEMVIANGSDPAVLHRILAGEEIGTYFHWIH